MRELTEGHTSQWFNGQGEFLLIVNILMMKLHHDLLRINVETGEDFITFKLRDFSKEFLNTPRTWGITIFKWLVEKKMVANLHIY